MRKLILAATLAFSVVLSFGQSTALAAPNASQTVDVTGDASFSSILGGSVSGPVALSGSLADSQLGAFHGSANFPLRDEKLTIAPTTSIALTTQQMPVGWYRVTCGMFGCTFENGISTFERSYGTGPVDVRLGSLKGNETLSLGTDATCVAACPPAGANWWAPTGYWQVQGAVLSSQDAGNLNMNGPAPTIH